MNKKIDLEKLSENVDYELVPVDNVENDQAWDIRILRGEFVETIIRYGNITFDGVRDCLTFNFAVIYSPDPEVTSENVEIQEHAGKILEDILERSYHEGWFVIRDKEENGHKSRTNDSSESSDQ